MTSKIEIQKVLKSIDAELGSVKASKAQNDAINKGAELVANKLRDNLSKFVGTKHSTGATRDELTIQKARKVNTVRMASVGWNGPKERYRIIHLNEWGYTRKGKKYRPRMYGTVTNTLNTSEREYFNTVYKELKKAYER